MRNLFATIGPDLHSLADELSARLSDPSVLELVLPTLRQMPACDVVEHLNQGGSLGHKRACLLSLSADCLYWVSDAIAADSKVERKKLNIAYTLVGPIADQFATVLPRYAGYHALPRAKLRDFITTFRGDPSWPGGGRQSGFPFPGGTLSVLVSTASGGTRWIDSYEHIIENVLHGVMGVDGLNRQAAAVLRRARDLLQAFQRTVISAGASTPSNQPVPAPIEPTPTPASGSTPGSNGATGSAPSVEIESPELAVRDATSELDSLIGLREVKEEVRRLISFLTIQRERQRHGLKGSSQSLHYVFTGNPGTGKTTVARILGRIFYGFGALKTAKVVECDRSKLVGGFLGQTAIKTDEVIRSALDAVLFIDEAYTLVGNATKFGHGDMYGEEAVNTLLKRMEDCRDRLIVIAAGYPGPMNQFLRSNPGLESRFTRFIQFTDYSVPELCQIFDKYCRSAEYSLTPLACEAAYWLFQAAYRNRDERFGNARFVRNVYEQVISRHSDRLLRASKTPDRAALVTLDAQDVCPDLSIGLSPHASIPDVVLWRAECTKCGKVANSDAKFLGQWVRCRCGNRFRFQWWNPVASASGNQTDPKAGG